MLPIESQAGRGAIAGLPRLVVVGVAVMAIGLGLDLVVHLAPVHDHDHAGFDPQEQLAHLVGVVGMLITWLGVVADGVRRQLRNDLTAERSPDARR